MWAPLPAAGSYSCEWVIPAASYCTLLNSLKQKSTINHTQTKKKKSVWKSSQTQQPRPPEHAHGHPGVCPLMSSLKIFPIL